MFKGSSIGIDGIEHANKKVIKTLLRNYRKKKIGVVEYGLLKQENTKEEKI